MRQTSGESQSRWTGLAFLKFDYYKKMNGFQLSLFGHALLILFVLFKGVFFPDSVFVYNPTLKVDLVGLPDLLKKDVQAVKNSQVNQEISQVLKKAEQEAKKPKALEPAKIALKKDEMVIKTQKQTAENKRALDRIKALAKVQDTDSENDAPKPEAPLLIKGNKISGGTSLSADAKESDSVSYLDLIRDRLQENWALPAWIVRQQLSAQVQIQIDSRGVILDLRWIKPSGNVQFDNAIKKAIQDSQPFPVPPKDLQSGLATKGILVGFPL